MVVIVAIVAALGTRVVHDWQPSHQVPVGAGGDDLLYAFDLKTPEQLLLHSDAVVVVTAVSEVPNEGLPRSKDGSGDGIETRSMTFSVDRAAWDSGLRKLPGELTTNVWGTKVVDGIAYPDDPPGEVRFEVGRQYLVPLALERDEWTLYSQAAFNVTDGGVRVEADQTSPLAKAVSGLSIEGIQDLLKRTTPDPSADVTPQP